MEKAKLVSERGEALSIQFNPDQLTFGRSNQWSAPEAKGKDAKPLKFVSGGGGTLSLKLVFDTTATGESVATHTDRLLAFMAVDMTLPDAEAGSNKGRPPTVTLVWGTFSSFVSVLERVQITYTMFAGDGTPLRANADVTLREYPPELKRQNPTSGTREPHTIHRVTAGETLDRISARHYGDATHWRLIADANRIVDPLAVPPGHDLVIPERGAVRRG